MSTEPFRNYDTWLSTNRAQEDADDAFETYFTKYHELATELVIGTLTDTVPVVHFSAVARYARRLVDGLDAEELMDWAAEIDAAIVPKFDDWYTAQKEA